MLEKLLIDRLTAAKALVNAMPESNALLAQLPAKINFFAVKLSGEVDQADIQILNYASKLLDSLEHFSEAKRDRIALVFLSAHFGMIHQHASEHRYAAREVLLLGFCLLVFGFERDRVPDRGLHLRQQLFGLLQGEEPGHPIRVSQAYTPETWTARDRLLGPSNSAKIMLCQVPRSTDALRTCKHRV